MRASLLPVLLLGLAACSREPTPLLQAGSAMPPPPGTPAAQADAAPATANAQAATKPAAAGRGVTDADPSRPAQGAPDAASARDDSRWVDVDPNQLETTTDPALAEFQSQQQQRDAELMQHDAEEAGAMRDSPRRDVDQYPQAGNPQGEYPQAGVPRDGADPRGRVDEGMDDDRGYDYPPEEAPRDDYDQGGFDEPPPYEPEQEYDPAQDEEYDPRDGYPRR